MPFEYPRFEVTRVIDGDTIRCKIDLGFRVQYEDTFRLMLVNTPERGKPGFEEAKAFTAQWLKENIDCILRTEKRDKYGRYLATFLRPDGDLATDLLTANLAKPYL